MDKETWLIWIVDDSPDDRAEMTWALLNGSTRRYRFREMQTGSECLCAVSQPSAELPDCLLLDDHLPDFDATELLRELGGFEAIPFPVVLLTGVSNWQSDSQILREGALEYLGKEWLNPGSLTRTIESAIERHTLITQRKALEEALRISERRFRTMFESAGEAMGILGPDGFQECNPATLRLYGCANQQEFLSKGPMDFSPPTQPDGRNSAELAAEHIQTAYRTGSHRFEWRHCLADGSLFDVDLLLTRIDLPNGPVIQAIARDITEKKRVEADAARLRDLLEDGETIAQFGSWEYIVASRETIWSPGECRIYGIDPGPSPDYAAMLHQCIHPDDAERLDRAFQDALANRRIFDLAHRIVRPDGTVREVRNLAHPRFDPPGVLVKYVGVTLDETERKDAEEALRTSETRLRLATEGAGIGIWSWDLGTGIVEWDALCAQHMALPEGKTPSYDYFASVLHPDDRASVERLIRDSLHNKTAYSAEYRVIHPDGRCRWIAGRGQGSYADDGRAIGMTGVTLDVTEAKRIQEQLAVSDKRFRLAMDVTKDGVWDWNLRTGETYYSPGYFRMLGYEPGSLPEQVDTWIGLLHPEERESVVTEARRLLATRGGYQIEFRLRNREDHYIWVVSRGQVVDRDAEGNPLRAVGTHVDITERKDTEIKLSRYREELEELVNERTQELHLQTEALTAANALMRAVIDTVPVRVFWKDRELRYLGCNLAFARDAGKSEASEVVGCDDFELAWSDQAERYRADDQKIIDSGTARLEFVEPQSSSDGRELCLLTSKVPLRSDAGEIIGILGVYQDVTERVLAEKALDELNAAREMERQRLFDVLEVLPVMICLLTPDHRLAYANRAFRDKFGGVTGRRCYESCFGLAAPCSFCEAFRVLETGKPHTWEVQTPDGCIIESYDFPFTDSNGQRMVLEMDLDVTEQRTNAAALSAAAAYSRRLLEASLDPLVTIDSDGRITDVNHATEEATGCPRDHLVGSDFSDYFTEPERARAAYEQVFSDGVVYDYPLTLRHRAGQLTEVLYNATVYRDEAGVIQGVFAAARDITARLDAERRLQENEGTLQRAQAVGRIGSWRLRSEPEIFEITAETARLFDLPVDRPATFSEWFARVHPDDQAAVETAWRAALRGKP